MSTSEVCSCSSSMLIINQWINLACIDFLIHGKQDSNSVHLANDEDMQTLDYNGSLVQNTFAYSAFI